MYVVIREKNFWRKCVQQKNRLVVLFFSDKSCKSVTRIPVQKITRRDDFFVHAFAAKKITGRDDFFVTRIYRKQNYTTYKYTM